MAEPAKSGGEVIDFTSLIGPAFWRAYNDFYERRYSTQCFSGGRGSLKSSAVSIFLILGLERDAQEAMRYKKRGDRSWRHYLTHAVCYRKVFGTCEQSVYSQIVWAIDKLGLNDVYKCSKSPLKIVRKPTGQMILFRGLDDPLKSKSLKAPFSFFRYLWFEEAAEFDGIEEIRTVCQSIHRGGHLFQTFYSYNPPETSANWINFEMARLEAKDPTFKRYQSNYLQVPREWLGDEFFREAALLKEINYRAYAHDYLGLVTGNGGSVFPNLVVRPITDAELATCDTICLGLDFGFSLDPSAFSAAYYQKSQRRLIVFDEIYETNLTNIDLARLIKSKPYVGTNYVMCDSAEPKSIAELEGFGINALPVVKTERRFGFKWLQSLVEIVVDPRRTPWAHKELSMCEYQKNKAGEFISKYPETFDHFIDSLRYATADFASSATIF